MAIYPPRIMKGLHDRVTHGHCNYHATERRGGTAGSLSSSRNHSHWRSSSRGRSNSYCPVCSRSANSTSSRLHDEHYVCTTIEDCKKRRGQYNRNKRRPSRSCSVKCRGVKRTANVAVANKRSIKCSSNARNIEIAYFGSVLH